MKKLFAFVCFGCLCVSILGAQQLENGARDAVNGLAERLMRPIEVTIGPIMREPLCVPVPFSRYLQNLIQRYADNIRNGNIKIVNVSEVSGTRGPNSRNEPQRGIIQGTIYKRGTTVEVSLNLLSANGTSLGTKSFSFPLSELSEDISIEPPNVTKVEERNQIFEELSTPPEKPKTSPVTTTPTTQKINIQAFFNSESMTYFHRDELLLTIEADRNCYFKILNIDANNNVTMLYPNSSDRNNYLKANEQRKIFENAKCYFYDPYGVEEILVIASSQQFANIEREYITPWMLPATTDNIRAAVRGGRGTEIESSVTPIDFSGEGEARYTITILKPHEEYSYGRPDDMREFYRSMQADISNQKGIFVGNETSAYYIIDGIRGSYRVSRNAPDKIQFAMYNLDTYISGSRAGGRTRGAGFNFNFERPGNILQAIYMVRTSIEDSGGTFTGNEQQGNFSAKGITGQYRVSNLVNVTITEKPFIIPNSLIEKEVKSYFGRE